MWQGKRRLNRTHFRANHDGKSSTTAMRDDELAASAAEVFKHFDRREAANEWALRLREWLILLFCWDGLLPIAVIGIPNLVKFLFPNWQIGLAILFVFVPVAALSIRFVIGWQRMQVGKAYGWQMVIFTVAISALFLFEAFILNDEIGNGPKIADPQTLITMFAIYVTMMAIAMFPFRRSAGSMGGAKPQATL